MSVQRDGDLVDFGGGVVPRVGVGVQAGLCRRDADGEEILEDVVADGGRDSSSEGRRIRPGFAARHRHPDRRHRCPLPW